MLPWVVRSQSGRRPRSASDWSSHGGASFIVLLLIAAGCAGTKPKIVERQHSFDPAEFAAYDKSGKAMVTGRAVVKSRLGHDITAAGDSVYMFPATPYSDEWWERSLIQGYYLADTDSRRLAYLRSTEADDEGGFQFGPLPAGEYYIVCAIKAGEPQPGGWQIQTVPRGDVVNVGKKIRLTATDTVRVILEPISRTRVLVDPPPRSSK